MTHPYRIEYADRRLHFQRYPPLCRLMRRLDDAGITYRAWEFEPTNGMWHELYALPR